MPANIVRAPGDTIWTTLRRRRGALVAQYTKRINERKRWMADAIECATYRSKHLAHYYRSVGAYFAMADYWYGKREHTRKMSLGLFLRRGESLS